MLEVIFSLSLTTLCILTSTHLIYQGQLLLKKQINQQHTFISCLEQQESIHARIQKC